MNQKPRKNQRQKLKKVSVSSRERWRTILKEVDKGEIPLDLLLAISVNLVDGTVVNINVKELIDAGNDPKDLKHMLDERFKTMESYIENIDFLVSIDDIARTVQPITDEILKDL